VSSRCAVLRPVTARLAREDRNALHGHGSNAVCRLLDRVDLVAEADHAAGDDVGAEAAAVNDRPEEPGSRKLLELGTRLGRPATDALDGADPEASTDETVDGDVARHAFRLGCSRGGRESSPLRVERTCTYSIGWYAKSSGASNTSFALDVRTSSITVRQSP